VKAAQAPRAILEGLLAAALHRVDPAAALRRHVHRSGDRLTLAGREVPDGARLVVLAAGKAAAAMAAALEELAADRISRGLVVTKDGHGAQLAKLALRHAGHPLPDQRSETAAREAIALVEGAAPGEVLVVLLSGGASALLSCPLPGLSRDDLVATTELLLASGVEIEEINTVRKHLTEISGGRLARRAASRSIEVLAISDVPGDAIETIASGPCAADLRSNADALGVFERRGLRGRVPPRVVAHLESSREDSVEPGDPSLARVRSTILASNRDALAGAREAALERGLRAVTVTDALSGEARDAGRRLVALARSLSRDGPLLLLAGGETTVTLRGGGKGGRNQELALAAASELAGSSGIALLAAGTDGTDGPTDAAGAYVDGGTARRGRALGLDARAALERNDSYSFFSAEGGLLVTGPTRTNVMDLVLVLVG
jgi:hydroxypyruvate reductase